MKAFFFLLTFVLGFAAYAQQSISEMQKGGPIEAEVEGAVMAPGIACPGCVSHENRNSSTLQRQDHKPGEAAAAQKTGGASSTGKSGER